jgi:porphobilinogen synthase
MIRLRRLRTTPGLRALVRETSLEASHLVAPLFVTAGVRREVASMPGVEQLTVADAAREAEALHALGVGAVLLFGIPAAKDARGSGAWATDGIVQQAVRAIRAAVPELTVITDVCLCEYTDHGHCGLVNGRDGISVPELPDGYVLNDQTLELLARIAVTHAQAGAHVVAPSAMIDGQVGAIRAALDAAGFDHVSILSYSAKYASAFYGPFRDAAEGAPSFGDRASHQMDVGNVREAMREHAADLTEGADALMVKPGLAYLDVVRESRQRFPDAVIAVYNVSGEYAMVKAAARAGWLDERRSTLEILTAMRRAGADIIITYHAKDAARWLRG